MSASAANPRRLALLRRLGAQVERLRKDLRRTSSESLLLCAMEAARPLTPAERSRATHLRMETWRIEQDIVRLRREYAALNEDGDTTVHRDVHRRARAGGPLPALADLEATV